MPRTRGVASSDGVCNQHARLSLDLERAALRALGAQYETLNCNFFNERLVRPRLLLCDSPSRLGLWDAEHRCLEISRELLIGHPWGSVIEVLKHEMAHQYATEVLGASDETAHGPAFRQVCEERGFDARATGMPDAGSDQEQRLSDPVLDKVARLLALAESPNQHEAESAMRLASKLMLKHNLQVIDTENGRYCYRHLGRPTGRVNEAERQIASILADYFFVEVIWISVWRVTEGKRGSLIEVCGSRENVELAEYVHAFLTHTAQSLWNQHRRANRIKGNRDRLQYVAGVMAGFREKLELEKTHQAEEGLVWVGDPAAREYLRTRHPYTRRSYYSVKPKGAAHQAGRQAGRRLTLHRGVKQGPSGGSVRLLRGARG